ncbi:FadR family transcriptional regulator [Rhodococcus rhodnii]|uniref:GntR family transcriptional regulator n=2 Tax=Rhodococcus rhodnii TaxID=38312 RepID=R7WNP9_9NOCA|nr:GntR family transcriptional regulator [Rhodococcus rhodnii]EOM76941.1 GntR family transcriptional regulator [Rhodococcus rhodnii LMG 5362]TXG89826.1 FadR family transcriptional regulator [Rhodococcus rhodnii]
MAAELTFEPAKTRRAFDDIIDQVRDRLPSGQLRPGDKLPSEREFAEQLGVSRNTVREALRMLEISGLIVLKKGHTGGAFVVDTTSHVVAQGILDGMTLTRYSLSDLTEARIGLESLILARVCERATRSEFDSLEEIVERTVAIDADTRWRDKMKVHLEFHQKLTEAAHNPILTILIQPLLEITHELTLRVGPSAEDYIIESRYRLLDALRRRDSDAAISELEWYLAKLQQRWMGGTD